MALQLSCHQRLKIPNKTVFTFGAEFINFNALRSDATEEQRRAFLASFLVPTRTPRPRTMRVGFGLDF